MSTSAIPALIDALVVLSQAALPAVHVSDGYDLSGAPDDDTFLMIGVEDPDSLDAADSAQSSQQAATMGTGLSRQEDGTISCVVWVEDGDGVPKVARDAAFAVCAAVADLCRTNPSLGIAGYSSLVTDYGTDQRLRQKPEDGAVAIVFFSVRFRARL